MRKPVVAIVGRPNVGKSTLFNRLAGGRLAIVDEVPGTTRDRLITSTVWNGINFDIIDTGGIDPTVGRKDPLSVASADYIAQIRQQAILAVRDADVVLFLTSALDGVTPADEEIAHILRKHQTKRDGKSWPPILLVVNKADNQLLRDAAVEFYKLGLGEPYGISALHGTVIGDLLDTLTTLLPPQTKEEAEDLSVKIAIVGKPNVGKSSLLNRLAGEERAIVSPIPGTTRDAIDTSIEFDNTPITLIDTAGVRRRGKILPGVEKYSIIRTMQAIERCDVALLMIDATSEISAQDLHIAGFIKDAWKSTVLLVNKWDAVEKDNYTLPDFTRRLRQALDFMDYVPVLFISALTGQRVNQVLPTALKVQAERLVRVTTSQVNHILLAAQDKHAPTSRTGRQLKIYYGTEVKTDPPTFLLHVNDPKLAHFTYLRFLENEMRKHFPFTGTPIHFVLRARRR